MGVASAMVWGEEALLPWWRTLSSVRRQRWRGARAVAVGAVAVSKAVREAVAPTVAVTVSKAVREALKKVWWSGERCRRRWWRGCGPSHRGERR